MALIRCCPKCGRESLIEEDVCLLCGTENVITIYEDELFFTDDNLIFKIYEEYVFNSPLYDEKAFKKQIEVNEWAKESVYKSDGISLIPKQQNKTTCPYCKSTNVSKISALDRTMSIGVFGLASSKVGKQWHCNGCKSDF